MKTSTAITLSILFQFLGILITAIILENGDITTIGLIVVIFILPIVLVGFLNGLLLNFAKKRKGIYKKRIWSFIPIIVLAVIAISNIRFLDGDMAYLGLIGLFAVGATNIIWNIKLKQQVI